VAKRSIFRRWANSGTYLSLSLSLSLSLLPKLAELSRRQQLALKIAQVPLKGDFRVTIF
jgi:hypothetical protein